MKIFTFAFCVLAALLASPLIAQYEAVVYNYEFNYFNNGQPLPAESYLLITGAVTRDVRRVEIAAYKARSQHSRPPLYLAVWKRVPGSEVDNFSLPFNYKLSGGSDYDFLVAYFRPVTVAERAELRRLMRESLQAYLGQSISVRKGRIRLSRSPGALLSDMNELVGRGLTYYRTVNEITFEGFSDVVKGSLRNLEDGPRDTSRANKLQDRLLVQLLGELEPVLSNELLVRTDLRTVRDYATEKIPGSVALNVGYGGVYLGGSLDDLSYGDGVYVGLSLPLGNRAMASRVVSNTSLSIGAFVNDFEQGNTTISGPIFGRPYYVGVGYSLFRFIRLNAGAAILEERANGSGGPSIEVGDVMVQPFIGISAEINLTLGLRDKR